jgi:hypothetical protein
LGLNNTLFSSRIQGLFGSGFDLTSKGFELVFISESIQPTMIYPLELISKNDLNTYKPQFQHFFFINNTSELFSLTCERGSCILWFLNELNLTYQRLTSFMASFNFIPIVLVPWDRFSLCHAPNRSLLVFQYQISVLIVSCVTM